MTDIRTVVLAGVSVLHRSCWHDRGDERMALRRVRKSLHGRQTTHHLSVEFSQLLAQL